MIKARKTETILPGESISVEIPSDMKKGDIVKIEPRNEAPQDFPKHSIIEIAGGRIKIENESKKNKNNTSICKIKPTVENYMGRTYFQLGQTLFKVFIQSWDSIVAFPYVFLV